MRRGPSMHEMEGPHPVSPRRPADCSAAIQCLTDRLGPETRLKHRSPDPPCVAWVSPGAVPVSGDKTISTASRKPAQEVSACNLENFSYPHVHPHDTHCYPPGRELVHRIIHSCIHSPAKAHRVAGE